MRWPMIPRTTTVLRAALLLIVPCTLVACVASPPPSTAPPTTVPAVSVVKAITFPVSGGANYVDSFGAPRSGGRSHEGQDLMGAKGTPLVAAVAGVVTRIRHDVSGLSGNSLTIRADDGWTYVYIHLNNDSPGTDDGLNPYQYAFAPGLVVGQRVAAGELVAYLGDSGNAESTTPHLHFEIHAPDGVVVNAYASLRAAAVAPIIARTW